MDEPEWTMAEYMKRYIQYLRDNCRWDEAARLQELENERKERKP